MTEQRDLDRLLDQWFGDGPNEVPDRVLDVVAARIGRQSQRPAWRIDWRIIHVNRTIGAAAAVAAVIVIGLVGLGLFGGGGLSVGGPRGNQTAAPPSAPASPSAAAPSPTPEVGVAVACDLVTADELAAALSLSSTVNPDPNIQGSNGDVNYCVYRAGGREVMGTSYRKDGGGPVFAAWKSNAGVQPVAGLGDEAVWDPTQSILYILKGSRLVSLDGMSTPLTLEAAKAIGAIAADRM
jgi:hypothetical protein